MGGGGGWNWKKRKSADGKNLMFVERSGLPATQTLPSNRTSQVIFHAKNLSVFLFSQATAQQENETKQNLQNKCN